MKYPAFFLLVAAIATAAAPSRETSAPESTITWSMAQPADAVIRGEWWTAFHDETLNRLERLAVEANQDLHAAAARVEQSRAAAGFARGSYWPQLALNGHATRERTSGTTDNVFPDSLTNSFRAPLNASWEIDLFGRVRQLNASARADADSAAAAFESVRLALTADVAVNYFSLRAAERELTLLRETEDLRRRALSLVKSRMAIGTASELDLLRAEAELAATEAEAEGLAIRHSALRHGLAVLVGASPAGFEVPAAAAAVHLPEVPADLSATMLERRPDIAAAERALAAANARIGVAKAAFFPAISLTGGAGFASGDLDRLFGADSREWSIGPRLYLPIFQGGRNRANLNRSRAAYDEAVALYRQRVLVAFREVQDALVASQHLGRQAEAQDRAVYASRQAARMAQTRYDAGYVSYLEVIDAQRTALAAERVATQLDAIRFNTRVALIKALGGGWSGYD